MCLPILRTAVYFQGDFPYTLPAFQYVKKINVFEGKKIEIVYRFQDELVTAARLAEQIGKTKQEVAV